jgi:outer membrane protein assembly factor BamB
VIRRVCLLAAAMAACAPIAAERADSMRAVPRGTPARDLLSLRWKLVTSDRAFEVRPQEFAAAAVWGDTVYVGSAGGTFFAVKVRDGAIRWRIKLGAVSAPPLVTGALVFVGTNDGSMVCLDAQTGAERWRYRSRGPIAEAPAIAGDTLFFSNEADQVFAVDARTGEYRWQYKSDTPEEFTLRGHAGVVVDDDLVFAGFSNGTMVALRRENGTVAWKTSLVAGERSFVDVDGTPVVRGNTVYVTAATSGVYALDRNSGQVRWRTPIVDAGGGSAAGAVGQLSVHGKKLYVAVADLGMYALDLDGNIIWRQGTRNGGEPATPVVFEDLLLFSLAGDGLFLADRHTGEIFQYFDPGDGISGQPVVTDDGQLYVLSNRGVLYAFDLDS